jgi:very-short-patch-repair endonuclease
MDPEKLRSLLEARMLRLCRLHPTAPAPLVNRDLRVAGRTYETDFRWPDRRLVVETDGFAFHGDPRSHERDRQRDQDLQLRGWRVYRFTWRQVTREPWRVNRVLDHYFPPA